MNKIVAILLMALPFAVFAQNGVQKVNGYEFSSIKDIEAEPVQNQNITGTCWSFSTLSFLESEVKRIKGMDVKLAEMWIVRNAYIDKARRYVRFHGMINFDEGGAFHDVTAMIKKYGIVPQSVYPGLSYGSDEHHHAELRNVLRSMCDAIIKNPNRELSTAWDDAIIAVVDAYLGAPVESFEYQGKSFTPQSFTNYVGINPDDYVVLTSFTHHPFYENFIIEIPDNWLQLSAWNVTLDEMMETMDNALEHNYSVAWAADVSEKGFSHKNGVAIIPVGNFDGMNRDEIDEKLKSPQTQENITVEMRQKAFDNYQTTDDHGMHIVGMYREKNGDMYYKVKNSWGTKSNDCDGYLFASDAYVRYKTIDIMVHKDAIPRSVKRQLDI
ncbi:aminopeptidase [bacterium]|nr:aminopeptidase [bacterium]